MSSDKIATLSCPFTSPLPQRVPRDNRRGIIMRKSMKRKRMEETKTPKTLSMFSATNTGLKITQNKMSEMEKLEARSRAAKAKCVSEETKNENPITSPRRVLNVKKSPRVPCNTKGTSTLKVNSKIEKMEINEQFLTKVVDEPDIPIKKFKSCVINSPKAPVTGVLQKIPAIFSTVKSDVKETPLLDPTKKKKIRLNRTYFLLREEKT